MENPVPKGLFYFYFIILFLLSEARSGGHERHETF